MKSHALEFLTTQHAAAHRYEEHISANTIKVVKLVFALIFWIHIDSCVFFLVARYSNSLKGHD